jgi:hypothetical protein
MQLNVNTDKYPAGMYYVNFIVDGRNIGSVKFIKL